MRRGPRSKPFRLGRARKVLGVPLAKSTLRDLNHAVKDIVLMSHVSEEERGRRLSICETCEHKRGSRCDLCGCFMGYKAKLKNSECPIGKWSSLLAEASVDGPGEQDTDEQNTHSIH